MKERIADVDALLERMNPSLLCLKANPDGSASAGQQFSEEDEDKGQ